MHARIVLIFIISIYVNGCTPKQEESLATPPPAPPVSVVTSSPTDVPAPPATVASGPSAIVAPSGPNKAAVPAQDFSNFTDESGTRLTELQILSTAVDAYEQSRFTVVLNEEDEPWPPLTNLTQLVTYRLLPRLPAAPAGKQWSFNPETKKVALK